DQGLSAHARLPEYAERGGYLEVRILRIQLGWQHGRHHSRNRATDQDVGALRRWSDDGALPTRGGPTALPAAHSYTGADAQREVRLFLSERDGAGTVLQ